MPTLLDLWFVAGIGFLGSFGHCVGMCGPLAAAFALSAVDEQKSKSAQLTFHILLNLGRLMSYALVGAGIGALGSVIFAGGELAGVGSVLRRSISVLTGLMLIWFGFTQAKPGVLPNPPFLQPARQQKIHEQLNQTMAKVAGDRIPLMGLTPFVLGLLWGLIPCGFLYAGQLRAAETQSWLGGGAIMLAFGAGTLPAMVTMGVMTSLLSQDRRSQLFRLGGWLTMVIGGLLLLRTGDTMSDYSGHSSLILLVLALIARPISRFWPALLAYRRVLGVGAFVMGVFHVIHMASHTWDWQFSAVQFMLPHHQFGVVLGLIALLLMLPAAVTSFDRAQIALGNRWRRLHLLSVPALLLTAAHTLIIGSSYWGPLSITWRNQTMAGGLLAVVCGVFMVRSPQVWTLLSLKKYYAPPKSKPIKAITADCGCDPDQCHDDDKPPTA